MGSYIDGMLRYFEFSGRSTRMQYWMFFVVQLGMLGAGVAIDYQLGGAISRHMNRMPVTLFMIFIHVVPAITVQVRRLHDIGKSGAWYLLFLVPFGGLVLLYWACRASEPGHNGYDASGSSNYVPMQSSIPRGVRMGSALASGRAGAQEPVEGRFI